MLPLARSVGVRGVGRRRLNFATATKCCVIIQDMASLALYWYPDVVVLGISCAERFLDVVPDGLCLRSGDLNGQLPCGLTRVLTIGPVKGETMGIAPAWV